MNSVQHLELLLRYDRALNLRRAIESAVRPGSRVLDAGCGVGLLSFWAARCGAEVVAVDIEGVDLAQDLAEENGLTDSVRLLKGDVQELGVPEGLQSFDVILAMIYLNDPRRDESQSELTYVLRDSHLAAGGKIIPDRVRYHARACDWPFPDYATRLSRLKASVTDIEGRYGLRFEALHKRILRGTWKSFFPTRNVDGRLDIDGGRILSERAAFADIHYDGSRITYPETFDLIIAAPGVFNTIIWTQELWFEDLLLFSNESLSWVAEPCSVEERARCTVRITDSWRRQNVVTVTP